MNFACAEMRKNFAAIYHLPGILVPSATKQIAVTESFMPKVHPKCEATSPIIAVTTPMHNIDTTKHKYPLNISKINEHKTMSN